MSRNNVPSIWTHILYFDVLRGSVCLWFVDSASFEVNLILCPHMSTPFVFNYIYLFNMEIQYVTSSRRCSVELPLSGKCSVPKCGCGFPNEESGKLQRGGEMCRGKDGAKETKKKEDRDDIVHVNGPLSRNSTFELYVAWCLVRWRWCLVLQHSSACIWYFRFSYRYMSIAGGVSELCRPIVPSIVQYGSIKYLLFRHQCHKIHNLRPRENKNGKYRRVFVSVELSLHKMSDVWRIFL